MDKRTSKATIAVGAVCAVCAIGGAAVSAMPALAASKASTAAAATTASTSALGVGFEGRGVPGGPGGRGHGGPDGGGRGDIHSESVRADPDGTGFITTVNDTGTISAIEGTSITIKEGTSGETFDTVEVTAGGTVTVQRNGTTAKLSSLKVGDHVRFSDDGTNVRIEASTAAFEKTQDAARAQREAANTAARSWPSA